MTPAQLALLKAIAEFTTEDLNWNDRLQAEVQLAWESLASEDNTDAPAINE